MGLVSSLEKHTVGLPSTTTDNLYGSQRTGDNLFSYCAGDVISDVVGGGDPLMQWLPSRGVNYWNEHVAHLSWVGPENYDGSASYIDFLSAQEAVGECDYGEGTDYNVCEYTHTMYRVTFSNKNKPLNRFSLGGMMQCQRDPQIRLRGDSAGLAIDNDADWAIARLGLVFEQHLDWNAIYGDPSVATGTGTYDGLDNIISTGWVQSHHVGEGSCDWTDPIVVSGLTLSTPEAVVALLKAVIRKIRARMAYRRYTPTGDDMVVLMSAAHWQYIADVIAGGAMVGAFPASFVMNLTPEAWLRERDRVTSGGVGFGFIPVDGNPVPVIPSTVLGANVTVGGNPGVLGDIYVLTKRFRGMNILEHLYLDWNQIENYPVGNSAVFQNGLFRASWVENNSMCFYYGLEMYGMIVSKMQPFQAKITDVTVDTTLTSENEGGSFGSLDWYAYDGAQGGAGVARIVGLS